MASKRRLSKKLIHLALCLVYVALFSLLVSQEAIPELTASNPIQLFINDADDDLKRVTKEAIESAKSSITIAIYSLTDRTIIDLLNRRAQEGIDILIVHDRNATPDIGFKLDDKIRASSYKGRGLMHYKLLIIDKAAVWFGSTNCTRDSFALHSNQMIGVYSEEFAKKCEEKIFQMHEGRRFRASPLVVQAPDQTMQFFFLPENSDALDKLIQTIETAKKSCRVAMYTFTHPKLQAALVEAKNRGVQVEVILDRESSYQTSRQAYERFKREKVAVFRGKAKGLVHHKMAIIDDTLVTGSANWTKAAFQYNDDCIAFIAPLTKAQSEKLEKAWERLKN